MKHLLFILMLVGLLGCKENNSQPVSSSENSEGIKTDSNTLKIHPISHATMVLEWDNTTIYIDPVGDSLSFKDYPSPDMILVTDIHGDHLNANTIASIEENKTKIIVPQAVADKMAENYTSRVTVLDNGSALTSSGFKITGIPMYNLREEALKFHSKGRGNGYVIEKGGKRVYISGDTEDIPEMRNLKDIDIAFVCMNLPYTMTVESAASAVLEFKPKQVYPYHYRGTDGKSDVVKFKQLVTEGDSSIEVKQLNWYPTE